MVLKHTTPQITTLENKNMKNHTLLVLTSFIVFFICGCALNLYNRSSVTSYNNNATTDGRIRLNNKDSHSVDGDKEKEMSTALSGEGAASTNKDASSNKDANSNKSSNEEK